MVPAANRQPHAKGAPIERVSLPSHQPIPLEAADDAGEVPRRDEEPPGEIGECQPIGSPVEVDEDVELWTRGCVLKAPSDLAEDEIVSVQELKPQGARLLPPHSALPRRLLDRPVSRSRGHRHHPDLGGRRRYHRQRGPARPRRSRHAEPSTASRHHHLRPASLTAAAPSKQVDAREERVPRIRACESLFESRHRAAVPSISTLAPSSIRAAT